MEISCSSSWLIRPCIIISLLALILRCSDGQQTLSQTNNQQDCLQQRCGSIPVSYPFKLSNNTHCPSYSSYFHLHCSSGGELYLHNIISYNNASLPRRVLHIDTSDHSIVVDATGFNASCSDPTEISYIILRLRAFPSPFFFSDDNLFSSVGCNTLGMIVGAELLRNASNSSMSYVHNEMLAGSCSVSCQDQDTNLTCGRNCCVSKLPPGASLRVVTVGISYYDFGTNKANDSTPCNTLYSTIFYPSFTDFVKQSYGIKLKWALPSNNTVPIANIQKSPTFACSDHSYITVVPQVPGYICSCQDGFYGDGYAQGHGCTDIDECAKASLNDCIPGKSKCHNTAGSYYCKCNSKIHVGNGMGSGSGCSLSPTLRKAVLIVCGILGPGLVIGGVASFAVWWDRRLKRKYFLQNGGLQVQELVAKGPGKRESRLFTAAELNAATDKYAEHMKLGIGGFGTVYKGILADGQLVAIKKAKLGSGGTEEFLNELKIVLNINHRHIIRFLGCCMETAVPLLVYEYASHGTVRQILDATGEGVMGWEQRLKVAKQTAEALAYLHAAAFPPILHRDVKSANVLLDDNLDAKVADFGSSRLIPEGKQHVSTAVQGTLGYLDPEYFQTLQLTDKSDVYSLGVMLVELISGLKPIDRSREPHFTGLSHLFIERMNEGREKELIDPSLLEPPIISSKKALDAMRVQVHSSIMGVAALAVQCLSIQGADRPSMSILADELRRIAHALENAKHDKDVNKDSPGMPSKANFTEQMEAGVVVDDPEASEQSASSMTSISNMNNPTLPR